MYPNTPQTPSTPPIMPAPITPPKKPTKKILLITISAIVILGIAIATILILINTATQSPTQPTTANVTLKVVDAPEVIVKDFSSQSISTRSTDYIQRQAIANDGRTTPMEPADDAPLITSPTNSYISFVDKESFSTNIPVTEYVQYERKDKSATENVKTVIEQTKSFLEEKGFANVSTTTMKNGVIYTNFDSTNVYCQLTENPSDPVYPPSFGIACTLKTFIIERYDTIKSLKKIVPAITQGAKTINIGLNITEGTQKLTTLDVIFDNQAKTLVFASQNKTFEYIGERPITNPDDENSFQLSDEFKTALNNPKWNGFLAKYIK